MTNRGLRVSAVRLVPQAPEQVYAFLARLENHWLLHDRYFRLDQLGSGDHDGRIVIGTPLGFRRTASIAVTTEIPPRRFGGIAVVGRRTMARVDWKIQPDGPGARVELEASVLAAGLLDRLLLGVGGRRWMEHQFSCVLARLAEALHPRAPLLHPAPLLQPRCIPSPRRYGTVERHSGADRRAGHPL